MHVEPKLNSTASPASSSTLFSVYKDAVNALVDAVPTLLLSSLPSLSLSSAFTVLFLSSPLLPRSEVLDRFISSQLFSKAILSTTLICPAYNQSAQAISLS